jgi:Protein of unknown function (DUF3309)
MAFALQPLRLFALLEVSQMSTILIVLLIILLLGAAPTWPYSRGWGYYPSGIVGLLLIVIVVLALTGRL